MKTSCIMTLYKECKHSYRYEPADKDEALTNGFYLLKAQCDGPAPRTILVTVTGLE